MSDLTLFDTDPTVRHGVGGTSVVWPSGVEVWATTDRQKAAVLALFNAAGAAPEPWTAEFRQYQADVMEPLRAEIRDATNEALDAILEAGDAA